MHYRDSKPRKDKTKNELVKEDIQKKIDADPELKNSKGQVFMDINAEGLRIQVVDEKGKPLFSSGGSVPSVSARRLLRIIGKSLQATASPIRLSRLLARGFLRRKFVMHLSRFLHLSQAFFASLAEVVHRQRDLNDACDVNQSRRSTQLNKSKRTFETDQRTRQILSLGHL